MNIFRNDAAAALVRTVLGTMALAGVGCQPDPQPDTQPATADAASPREPEHLPGPGLHGRVVDELGEPLAGVSVHATAMRTGPRLVNDSATRGTAAPGVTTVTDGGGSFHLRSPPIGDLALVLTHPHFATQSRRTNHRADGREELGDLILTASAGLLVEVRAASAGARSGATLRGAPIRGATVRLRQALREDGLPPPTHPATATTDTAGIATFYGVAPGPWLLTVTAPGRATTTRAHSQPSTPTASPRARVTLPLGHTLNGRLRGANGEPVPGALVIATTRSGPADPAHTPTETRTDAEGSFRLEGLHGGRQWLLVLSDSHGFLRRGDVDPDADALDLRLPAGFEIRGRVLHGRTQRPVAGAVITARSISGWPALRHGRVYCPQATSDATGKFRFRGLPAGILTLEAVSKGLCPAAAGPLAPTAPGDAPPPPVTMVLQEGFRVTGQILSPAGLPHEDAVIRSFLLPTDETALHGFSHLAAAAAVRSRAGGRFEIIGLLPGRYRIEVSVAELPAHVTRAFTARPNGRLDMSPIRLRRGGTVAGTAFDGDGQAARRATVHLRLETGPGDPASRPPAARHTVLTDTAGHFQLPPVAPGTYRMFYDYPDRQSPRAATRSRTATRVTIRVTARGNHTQDLRPRVR